MHACDESRETANALYVVAIGFIGVAACNFYDCGNETGHEKSLKTL